MFEHVGTVRLLRDRIYLVDRWEFAVEPGAYPLYSDGLSYFWMMDGVINLGGMFSHGDGLFTMGFDERSTFKVRFPSRIFGAEEFEEWLKFDECLPGPKQRIEIIIKEKETA